ncbi:hypothetical protein [Mucilaginibacter ginkgonis]|uniref:Uncharacterized protein n=1 Tax=Mucilaginibacter ginkgonis TaxID=2682091 RepID=A0A6I4I6L0_9SPHI|nr:hypothetical protein [Mucilaginibacter ginkgonis]QQL50664.1 hypothetical protein GO620_004180 [Mucilaginibacter ginkgonis]
MKKFIIAAAIIIISGITALSVAKNLDTKAEVKTIKIEKAEFAGKGFSAEKSDISSAD